MATTLTYGVTTLTLPVDMLWSDEFSWPAVQQSQQYTIAGSLVIEATAKLSGRSITLSAGDDYAWTTRATLDTLRTWSLLPAQTFSLLYRGVTHSVIFDHAAGAIDARPIIDYSDPDNTDDYAVTLRFIKV
jgi:hypothetical protein